MKRTLMIAIGMLLLTIIGALAIRGNVENTNITEDKTIVGVLLNGTRDDHSWCQSHVEGLESAAVLLNLELHYKEQVASDRSCLEKIEKLINEGCTIIIGTSYSMGSYLKIASEEHSDIKFFHASGLECGSNLTSYYGRMYEIRYLSGIVAGLQTRSNEIGYVAAFRMAEVNRGINAFTLGVRSVNPEATVRVVWSGSWTSDDRNTAAAEDLLTSHPEIDVLTMHSDSLAPLAVAQKHGIWAIGYNMDNREMYPDTVLTSAVWQWDPFYSEQLFRCLQNKFHGTHIWEGIDSGLIQLAPLSSQVRAGTEEKVREAEKRLRSGTFGVFYGPIRDHEGHLRVPENESMTDQTMLEDFDWFVEGVTWDQKEG